MKKEDAYYSSIGEKNLAEAYVGYIAMTDREKIDTDTLGFEIASAVNNVRGNLDPGEWAQEILENAEQSKSLEEKAAGMLDASIIKRKWNIYEHTGLARQILSECGIHNVYYGGEDETISKANDVLVINYCNSIVAKYASN